MLESQFKATQALRGTIGNDEALSDRQRRKILDRTLAGIAKGYEPVVMPLPPEKLRKLENIQRFAGFRIFKEQQANFPPAGLTDSGATALFVIQNCLKTSTLDLSRAK